MLVLKVLCSSFGCTLNNHTVACKLTAGFGHVVMSHEFEFCFECWLSGSTVERTSIVCV